MLNELLSRASPPPRIAVDLRAIVPQATGTGIYTLSLLEALGRRGTVRLLGMTHRRPRQMRRLTAAGISIEEQSSPSGIFWQQCQLPLRLSRGDIDLLWSSLPTLPLRLPVPAIVTVHDLMAFLDPETQRLRGRLAILPFLRRSLEQASRVVAESESTARDLRSIFPACSNRVQVIPCGVDEDFRPGSPQEVVQTRQQLGCPEGYLFFAGTLEPRKNLCLLLRVWEALRRTDRGMPPLVLVGDQGSGSRELLRHIRSLRSMGLRHLGEVSRDYLVRLFQAATVFVYPPLHEEFGLPVAEAMACGVPTVVSNTASLNELVGEAALQVQPDDPQALTEAIRTLLTDPALARQLGQRGRERARRFDWAQSARQMEQLLAEVIQSNRRSDAAGR